jgi:glycosyltransferase involved in cell wall biosynthesis
VADEDPQGHVASLVRRNLRAADLATAPSRFLADAAIELGADPERMTVVPNAVDKELFFPRPRTECRLELGLPADRPLAVFLGRAIEMKGAPDLVTASEAVRTTHPDLQVAFVGTWPGRLPDYAGRFPDTTDAPLLHRDGAPREELPLWLGAADMVVVPSRYEGFGLVALEALACARPLVLTSVGGLPEVVPESCGAFVPPADPAALAAAIRSLLEDPARADRMGARGPEAAAGYSWTSAARSFADLYERLASESPSPE